MKHDSPVQAFTVVMVTAVACALLVSAAVVWLRPVQADNDALRQARVVLALLEGGAGHVAGGRNEILARFRALDARVVNLDTGRFEPGMKAHDLDVVDMATDPVHSDAIPAAEDWAGLGRRARYAAVYIEWSQDRVKRLVVPVHGAGMWSTIRGYVVLGSDLNTVAGATFHELAETPGVGDRITGTEWLQKWRGRKIYDENGVVQFAVASGQVPPGSASELYQVDALTGATVTANAVTHMMRFWFGPWGFRDFLQGLRENSPPAPAQSGAEP